MIGVVLVAMAALAVYTGLRYRDADAGRRHRASRAAGARDDQRRRPSRRAGAGRVARLSRRCRRQRADRARRRHRPRARRDHAAPARHQSTVRIWARRGMITNVVPDDAMVYVNDLVIGQAKQFDTPDEIYDFPAPGSYTVHIVAPGYKEQQFIVTVADDAKEEIAQTDGVAKTSRVDSESSPPRRQAARSARSAPPVTCSALPPACCSLRLLRLGDDLFLQVARHFLVVRGLHVEAAAALRDRAQRRAVGQHLRRAARARGPSARRPRRRRLPRGRGAS